MDDEELSIAEIRSAISCKQIVEALGFSLDKDKTALREERSPSTHIWDDHWYDFGSGEHGHLTSRSPSASGIPRVRMSSLAS